MSIHTETAEGVCRIEIARPEKKNALTGGMYERMTAVIAAAHDDDRVRAVVVHGQPDVFTAGNDLEDFLNDPPTGMDAPVFRFMTALARAEMPVLAAVNGPAVGIGTTLLAHVDLAYCAADSVFSMPFVSLGLCAEFGSSLLVPLAAGYHKAAEKLLLGEPITATEAVEMRLVNGILPPGEVLEHTLRQARRFKTLPPNAVRETKRLMKSGWRSVTERTIADEAQAFARLLRTTEAREACAAFFARRAGLAGERRPPPS